MLCGNMQEATPVPSDSQRVASCRKKGSCRFGMGEDTFASASRSTCTPSCTEGKTLFVETCEDHLARGQLQPKGPVNSTTNFIPESSSF